jgi:hypothetical protein
MQMLHCGIAPLAVSHHSQSRHIASREEQLTHPKRSPPMTFITSEKPGFRLSALVLRPVTAIWNWLMIIAESHPRLTEITRLNAQTDADLLARGTTREAEVRRIFANHSPF